MLRARSFQFVLLLFSLAVVLPPAVGQITVATVPAGASPFAVAVNSVTNKTYVANFDDNTVTVIDGATNNTTTVSVGVYPEAVTVNPVTNKIYVANNCGNDPNCASAGTITVIDGATNNTTTVTVGAFPNAVTVDPVTNQIYVANNCGSDLTCSSAGTVTVIDGATNNTATVTVGNSPYDVEVNSVTNQIYVVNNCGEDNSCNSPGTVTVIDGVTNNTATVGVGDNPYFAAVNSTTNQIYVTNNCGNDISCGSLGTVTAINGATNGTTTVNVGAFPNGVAVNATTNMIYVANNCGNDINCGSLGTVTAINGATNGTTTVNVGAFPYLLAVDAVTNETYVPNYCGSDPTCSSAGTVTVIDGSNNTVPVAVGDGPQSVAVNATTDRIYVPNYADGTVSVIAGAVSGYYYLSVSPNGNGTVTSTDGFINCPGTCYYSYPANTQVTLNANPDQGWTFTGWSGACTGTGSCNVTVTQNLSVTATFSQQNYLLTVSTNGSGTVTSTDGDINCPSTCGNSYSINTHVTLNATAAQGWSFAGWSGACSGTGSCNVVMTQDVSVTAAFTQNQGFYNLTVFTSGSGTVTSTDGFINCPGTCSYSYAGNAQVTLNASPGQGGTFSGWSGACTGTGSCSVTMTKNLSAIATFTGQQDMVAHSFGNGNDGQNPFGSLIVDSAGKLYGTTSTNGMYGKGTVFVLSANGTETVLYNFGSGNDGQNPHGNLIFDSAGNLYGTTSAGGIYGNGTVFELSPNGTETVLYNFGNSGDGQNPSAGLIFDTAGNLYGTTVNGGVFGSGTAFELSPNGGGSWTETFLYSFGNGNDGQNPYAALVFDNSGNLYGTTANGGLFSGGTIFELLPNNANNRCCREILVYSFGSSSDGQNPYAGLIFDSSGNLYGTAANGGANGGGTAFEVSPNGGGGWTETFLYSFGSSSDGQNPYAGLIFDNTGNLYGTTAKGGLYSGGTVFELSPSSSANNRCCREILVYSFGSGSDARNPHAGLVFDSSGNLHGTSVNGGVNDSGTVFGIRPGPPPVQFVTATPCRVVDTRNANGTFGGPPITGGTYRSFPIPQGNCNIPTTAAAYSLNVTVVPSGQLGYLTIWPTGENQPVISTMNSLDGRIKANAAIVPAGTSGAVSVYVTNTTNVVLDIDGYFTTPAAQTLQFYPLVPCRVLDTRNANGDLGGPFLTTNQERDFPVLSSACNIPSSAQAYSLNFTVVPYQGQSLGYLTVWPQGGSQPKVSTLNNLTATIVANAAIVPAGTGGGIATYPSGNTQLVADIDGYFAPAGTGGLSLYPAVPCRVIDTRKGNGQFSGELTVDVVDSACAPPSAAQAYVLNATVVPAGGLGYLTLWPDSENKPVVSTLNAIDGAITSNMAIVPNINGSTDAYASGITQLILDISSYFAP